MKLVNKARKLEVEAFSHLTLNKVCIERFGDRIHIKCDFDNHKGQFEIVIPKRIFEQVKVIEE